MLSAFSPFFRHLSPRRAAWSASSRTATPIARSLGAVALLLLIVLTGCTPDPVYRLSSTIPDSSSQWIQGRQVVTRTQDSLRATVAYVRTTNDGHLFDVRLANLSDTSLLIDPSDFYAVTTQVIPRPDTVRTIPDSFIPNRASARDPEEMLLAIDLRASEVEANARTSRGLYALEGLTSVADDVADIAGEPDTEQEETREAVESIEREQRRENDVREYRSRMTQLERRRFEWAQRTLRRTSPPPGMGVSGRVYVPVDPNARFVLVHVGRDGRYVVFPYRQKKYEPDTPNEELHGKP